MTSIDGLKSRLEQPCMSTGLPSSIGGEQAWERDDRESADASVSNPGGTADAGGRHRYRRDPFFAMRTDPRRPSRQTPTAVCAGVTPQRDLQSDEPLAFDVFTIEVGDIFTLRIGMHARVEERDELARGDPELCGALLPVRAD